MSGSEDNIQKRQPLIPLGYIIFDNNNINKNKTDLAIITYDSVRLENSVT